MPLVNTVYWSHGRKTSTSYVSIRASACLSAGHLTPCFRYLLILCNAIGTPVDSKYLDMEPLYVTMTRYHVVAASERRFTAGACNARVKTDIDETAQVIFQLTLF